ncbi:MAG: peptide-methionine (S)-S-oxide reductase [Elusimicrobia bacterium CG_4_10_14_0_2_um_filter_56_8]|nr:MAG: peptide-methionine (S)-S-oxide reductase [Elusimicrobia bacterium CG_4_10_14_0_2_um_filter_56_8]
MKKLILILIAALAPQLYAGGLPARSKKMDSKPKTETATLAGGCFWGVEDILRALPGVTETVVGYTGGKTDNPKYEDVKTGKTGHAESIELRFDPAKITYGAILDMFFRMHDPTTPNRQGNDIGSQYRSAIFYHGEEQKKEAEAAVLRAQASGRWKRPVTTEVVPAVSFWPAEDYHQDYLKKHVGGYTCHYIRD